MDSGIEKVLCCVRVSNADLIVTSGRIIHQSLNNTIRFIHSFFQIVFFFVPSEGIFGMETSAWSNNGKKLLGGESFFGPSADSQKIINQSRIIHSLPFNTLKEINIQPAGGDSIIELVTEDEEIVFRLGDSQAGILCRFLPDSIKTKFGNKEHKKRISDLGKKYIFRR